MYVRTINLIFFMIAKFIIMFVFCSHCLVRKGYRYDLESALEDEHLCSVDRKNDTTYECK